MCMVHGGKGGGVDVEGPFKLSCSERCLQTRIP